MLHMPLEVEKKFAIKPKSLAELVKDAEFLGEKTFSDTYLDTTDFSLTTKDIWLRTRDGKFELKLPQNQGLGTEQRAIDQYQELTDEEEIRQALNIENQETLEEDLKKAGITPFCTIVTTRKKYRKNGFTIDIDEMDYGYNIGEIEMMVEDNSEAEDAVRQILSFARQYRLGFHVKGKVIEWIKRNNPTHFQALVKSGTI